MFSKCDSKHNKGLSQGLRKWNIASYQWRATLGDWCNNTCQAPNNNGTTSNHSECYGGSLKNNVKLWKWKKVTICNGVYWWDSIHRMLTLCRPQLFKVRGPLHLNSAMESTFSYYGNPRISSVVCKHSTSVLCCIKLKPKLFSSSRC